jgi:HK97 family phage prohead protease
MKQDKEIRNLQGQHEVEGNHITGYAVRFNEQSEYLGFYEVIAPSAISDELLQRSNVMCLFNHDTDKVLGRSLNGKGNLKLTRDENGIKYDCELLDNELAKTVRSYIEAGLINTSSFAFTVADDEDAQVWTRNADGSLHRTIRKIDGLYDVSPVWDAAYSTTSCACRSLDKFLEEEKRNKEEEDKLQAEYQEFLDKIEKIEE